MPQISFYIPAKVEVTVESLDQHKIVTAIKNKVKGLPHSLKLEKKLMLALQKKRYKVDQ